MNAKTNITSLETTTTIDQRPVDKVFNELLSLEPKLVTVYVPEKQHAIDQKEGFLNGVIDNPSHAYDRLESINFPDTYSSIEAAGGELLEITQAEGKLAGVYEDFVTEYEKKTRFMELSKLYKTAENEAKRSEVRNEWMRLNIELYGEPERETYESLLYEKLAMIASKTLSPEDSKMRDELFGLVDFSADTEAPERFKPSNETMEWMNGVVHTLYDGMLRHIPDESHKEGSFSVQEVQSIFQTIISNEFGEAAEGWTVDVEDTKSINVKTSEKRIVIPEDRGELSRATLEGLVVHELGVHMMRSITGGDTDLRPLSYGLSKYYDAEEGLGVVMEQALKGTFREAGVDHYLTAGLAYYDNKDFRGAYEVKWRIAALTQLNQDQELTDEMTIKAQKAAYAGVMRSMRGTDELPWFKDLAYYNGAVGTWKHLESIKGDDLMFMFMLMGKVNPANTDHQRYLLETKSI